MGRRKGQSWWNWFGNALPVVKWFVKGENYQPDLLTEAGKNVGYNLNSGAVSTPIGTVNTKPQNKESGMSKAGQYVLPALGAASSIVGSAINANSQEKINEQQIAWAMKNYQMSREDAIAFWERENAYNTPAAQMGRLKEAGLNPHLVYGNGATATGGQIQSPQYQSPSLRAPQWGDAVTGAGNILASQMMMAQIDKTKAETRRIDVDQESQVFDLSVKREVGYDRLAQELKNRVTSSDTRTSKEIVEFESWVSASLATPDGGYSQWSGETPRGTFSTSGDTPIVRSMSQGYESNELINKAKKAGIQNTIQELENLKKRGILYDDQHALNQIQIKLQDFQESLSKMGISPTSIQALSVLVTVIKAAFGN